MKEPRKTQKQRKKSSSRSQQAVAVPKINEFTADMHFIVTRNKRNAWMDDLYEMPPDTADYPVFN